MWIVAVLLCAFFRMLISDIIILISFLIYHSLFVSWSGCLQCFRVLNLFLKNWFIAVSYNLYMHVHWTFFTLSIFTSAFDFSNQIFSVYGGNMYITHPPSVPTCNTTLPLPWRSSKVFPKVIATSFRDLSFHFRIFWYLGSLRSCKILKERSFSPSDPT